MLPLSVSGGTIDTTVHEVVDGRHLRELYKASGGPWGGAKVDLAFERMLSTLVGDRVFEEFKQKCAYDYLDIFRSFENIKRSITPDSSKTTGFRYPMCLDITLREIAGTDMEQRIALTFKTAVGKKYERLKLSAELGRSFFKEVIDKIVESVKNLLEIPAIRGVDTILMVGGFSDSSLLQHAIRSNFEHKVKVIKPNDAELAIVKGAVLFGYNPSFIQERIAKFTYGTNRLKNFIEGVHDPTEKVERDGVFKCDNLFSRFVKVGDVIRFNKVQGENFYMPASERFRNMHVPVYACTSENPMYVKDVTCKEIGSVTIDILDRSVPREQRRFRVRFIFSDTEIKVSVTEVRTGNSKELYLKFKESQ